MFSRVEQRKRRSQRLQEVAIVKEVQARCGTPSVLAFGRLSLRLATWEATHPSPLPLLLPSTHTQSTKSWRSRAEVARDSVLLCSCFGLHFLKRFASKEAESEAWSFVS